VGNPARDRLLSRIHSIALAFLMTGLMWSSSTQASQVTGRVEPVEPCFVAPPEGTEFDVDYDCGYIVLPENASKPDGREVKLDFLRVIEESRFPGFILPDGSMSR
jgi:hypothetical protein